MHLTIQVFEKKKLLQVFKLLILLVPRQDMFLTFLYIDECFINLRFQFFMLKRLMKYNTFDLFYN
jgi:hypothetical protein